MQYFDDILNVYAYLRSKMQEQTKEMRSLAQQTLQLHKDIDRTTKDIQNLELETDAFLNNAITFANEMGIDISDILSEEEAAPEISGLAVKITETGRIKFPKDYNFEEGFEKLIKEAHEAGFTDVHPEQLLTSEEMADAEAFSQQLDEEFEKTTRLKGKDMAVLMIAVVLRVVFYYLKQFLVSVNNPPSDVETLKNQSSDIKPDASSGVDIEQVLEKNKSQSETFDPTQILDDTYIDLSELRFVSPLSIREESGILQGYTSFDVEETDFFSKDQIIGYDKYLGWIFGVCNILTDTVTIKSFKSYSVARLLDDTVKPFVDREVSTLFQIIYPTVGSVKYNKESIVAAVVREATELGIVDTNKDSVLEIYKQALALEDKSSNLAGQSRQIFRSLWEQADQYLEDVAFNSFVNMIVAAVHSLMYRSSDGDLSRYVLRTNKIILYSSMIAASVNSIQAFLMLDPTKIDFGGLISTLLSLFHSTAFWIDIKTDFLVNTYKKELTPYMDQLNKEFDFV